VRIGDSCHSDIRGIRVEKCVDSRSFSLLDKSGFAVHIIQAELVTIGMNGHKAGTMAMTVARNEEE
jgi:hypothetical protein